MSLRPWLSEFRARLSNGSSRRKVCHSKARGTRPVEVVQQLEERTLLAATALVIGTDLTVLTDADEAVTVGVDSLSGNAEVLINGAVLAAGSTISAGSLTSLSIRTGSASNQIDLSAITSGVFSSLASITVDAGNGDDTIIGAASVASTLSGGDGNDSITGGSSAEVILGGDGQDTIDGGDGNDDINAGDGDDSVTAGAGDDTVTGDDGDDIVFGGAGNDSVLANNGADSLFGEAGDDTLNGDGGFDLIDGGDGNDLVFAGADNDTVSGGLGNDTINGQSGNDSIDGNEGDDSLSGQVGNDSINGGDGNDVVNGNAGDDLELGNAGNDTIFGGSGNDSLFGNDGDDTIRGNSGKDTIAGGAGSDFLDGGTGNDLVRDGMTTSQAGVLPTLSLDDVSVTEGDTGMTTVTFTVSLSSASAVDVMVDYSTADGTATAGSDYVAAANTLTFTVGQTSQMVTVTVNGDTQGEVDEVFFLDLSNPTNATIAVPEGTATIISDDAQAVALFGNSFNGDIYQIDPVTAASTLVGGTGLAGLQGLTTGPGNTVYGTTQTTRGLYTIDVTTATCNSHWDIWLLPQQTLWKETWVTILPTT